MQFTPIAHIETCFKEKFGIPRQPGLTPSAWGVIRFENLPYLQNALQGLEGFSHLWVIFVFHQSGLNLSARQWKPSIRPPRLGGAKKVGVLASRSPHRPNPIGMSVVKIERINLKKLEIDVSGVDLLDGTPVLDIKPYIPYCDSIPRAKSGWVDGKLKKKKTRFTKTALQDLKKLVGPQELKRTQKLISEILALDPRPAFQQKQTSPSTYGFAIGKIDVKWETTATHFVVTQIDPK